MLNLLKGISSYHGKISSSWVAPDDGEQTLNLPAGPNAVRKSSGTNASERYLTQLAERTFLSLWRYPGIYRNQQGSGGDGKEVCDLLVIFETRVIIFSDKNIAYQHHSDAQLAWKRWYKKTIKKLAEQIYGAERWIKDIQTVSFLILPASNLFRYPFQSQNGCKYIVLLSPMALPKAVAVLLVAAAA